MARKRRGRSEGSIFQRADGTWTASVSLGYDGSGKRKRKTVYGQTKAKVQEKLRKLHNDSANGIDVTGKRITVGQWLTRWLELVKPTVEPNTYGPYESHIRLHIAPRIGSVVLPKLAAFHVQGLYANLTAAGVSSAMQRKIGTTLTIALNQAIRMGLLASNSATKIRKPKAAKPTIEVFGLDEAARFLDTAHGDQFFPLYRTALDSGARPGELYALLWEDVDFAGGFISITKSLEALEGAFRVKGVKTAKGRRRIDLSPETLAVLAEHRKAALAASRIAEPVFPDPDGGYMRSNTVNRSIHAILKRAALPQSGMYTLRHTSATLLLLAEVPAKVVSERLGHSSITLTLDTYSHVLPAMSKRAADMMGRMLGTTRKAK